MNPFQTYLKSFHDPIRIGKVFVIDTVAIGALFLIWYVFLQILTKLAYNMSGGKTIEDIKAQILLGSPEMQQALLTSIKTFVLVSIIGTIVLIGLTLLLFSYSRLFLWKELVHAKHKLGKWVALLLLLLVFLVVYVVIVILLKYIVSLALGNISNTLFLIVNTLFNFSFMLVGILFVNLAFYTFTHTAKILESVANTFHLIRTKWSILWKAFLLMLVTGIIISLLTSFITYLLYLQPTWINSVVTILLFLLYLAWMRIYLVKTLHEQSV